MGYLEKCGNCGGDLEYRQEGSCQGMFCQDCTWSVVATYFPEYITDETVYCIFVTGTPFQDLNKIRVISNVAGMNYLEARQLLQKKKIKIFAGRASEIMEIREKLIKAGVSYEIDPEFKYQDLQVK